MSSSPFISLLLVVYELVYYLCLLFYQLNITHPATHLFSNFIYHHVCCFLVVFCVVLLCSLLLFSFSFFSPPPEGTHRRQNLKIYYIEQRSRVVSISQFSWPYIIVQNPPCLSDLVVSNVSLTVQKITYQVFMVCVVDRQC